MISIETRQKWMKRIGYCQDHYEHMTDWEMGFIDSVDEQMSRGKILSGKQSRVLGRIFHRIEEEVG